MSELNSEQRKLKKQILNACVGYTTEDYIKVMNWLVRVMQIGLDKPA